jgi:hypothetical protein
MYGEGVLKLEKFRLSSRIWNHQKIRFLFSYGKPN